MRRSFTRQIAQFLTSLLFWLLASANLHAATSAQPDGSTVLPDLVVSSIDTSSASFDVNTLMINGNVNTEIQNQGTAETATGFDVLAFLDLNRNDAYDVGSDTLLGQTIVPNPLATGVRQTIPISVNSELPFRDAPISIWVDSSEIVEELNDGNNVGFSANDCVSDSPMGYLRFEEGISDNQASGSDSIVDSSIMLNHGSPVGSPTYRSDVASPIVPKQGKINSLSMAFAGNDSILFNSTFPFHNPGDATLEFWIKFPTISHQSLFWTRSDSTDSNRFNIFVNSNGTLAFDYNSPSGIHHPLIGSGSTGMPVTSDTWTHIAISRMGNEYSVYKDGVLYDTATDVIPDLPTSTGWGISNRPTNRYIGALDEIRVTSKALSPSQFLNAENGEPVFQLPDLTASRLQIIDNGSGQPASLTVRIGNGGILASPEGVPVNFYDGDPNNGGVLLGTQTVSVLETGQFVDVALDVQSITASQIFAVVDAGNVVVECRESNNSVSAPFSPGTAQGVIVVATDKMVYGGNSPVALTGTIMNPGFFPYTLNAQLFVEDINGVLIKAYPQESLGSVASGATVVVSASWNTEDFLSGSYRARGVLTDANGALVNETVAQFTVENIAQSLTGTVTVQQATLLRGDSQVCDFAITNVGTYNLTALPIQLLLVNIATGDTVTNDPSSIDLGAGQTENFMNDFSTASLTHGNYNCVLQVTVNGKDVPLSNAIFRVNVPAVQFTALLTQPQATRTLVLMDPDPETCAATQSITLEVNFDHALSDDSRVFAKAYYHFWRLLDVESATPGEFTDSVNENLRENVDVALTELDANHLQMQISSEDSLSESYRFQARYLKNRRHHKHRYSRRGYHQKKLDTGRVQFPCGQPPTIGETLGDFTVVDVSTVAQMVGQPHSVEETPSLPEHRAFLEQLMNGRSFTVVENIDDFKEAFLSGQYQQYLLLAHRIPLDTTTSRLLKEAINRGEGLVFAGGGYPAKREVFEALGLKSRHKHHHKHYYRRGHRGHDSRHNTLTGSGIEFLDSPLFPEGTANFSLESNIPEIELEGAALAGKLIDPQFRHSHGHRRHKPHHDGTPTNVFPVVTFHETGMGRAVFIGADALAEAATLKDAASNPFADLLLNSLDYTHPHQTNHRAEAPVPVQLTLGNQGADTPVTAVFTLPLGSTVDDTVPNAVVTDDQVVWSLNLEAGGNSSITLWVIPAYTDSLAQVNVDLFTGAPQPGNLVLQTGITLTEAPLVSLRAITQSLKSLLANGTRDRHLRRAKWSLMKAQRYLDKGKLEKALYRLLSAAASLERSSHTEAPALRKEVDWQLWRVSQDIKLPPHHHPGHHHHRWRY
jgi:concanavalin A-like lectin/glucanase superfamily protein/CARDB protein